jgi:hypothetical protein
MRVDGLTFVLATWFSQAGERMYRHCKARGVKTMPTFEVFVGRELVERIDATALVG